MVFSIASHEPGPLPEEGSDALSRRLLEDPSEEKLMWIDIPSSANWACARQDGDPCLNYVVVTLDALLSGG